MSANPFIKLAVCPRHKGPVWLPEEDQVLREAWVREGSTSDVVRWAQTEVLVRTGQARTLGALSLHAYKLGLGRRLAESEVTLWLRSMGCPSLGGRGECGSAARLGWLRDQVDRGALELRSDRAPSRVPTHSRHNETTAWLWLFGCPSGQGMTPTQQLQWLCRAVREGHIVVDRDAWRRTA